MLSDGRVEKARLEQVTSKAAGHPESNWPIIVDEDCVIAFENSVTLQLGATSGFHVYATLRTCIRAANAYVIAVVGDEEIKKEVMPFLSDLASALELHGGTKRRGEIVPFSSPSITQVEEAAYLYKSSFGPIQIGIHH